MRRANLAGAEAEVFRAQEALETAVAAQGADSPMDADQHAALRERVERAWRRLT